jgi:trafficking protein particle complex subunit 8
VDTHLSFDVQPAVYCGRLTYRAILEPTQYTSFPALVWIGRPGTYALGAWRVETEVLEIGAIEHARHRYSQEPSLEDNPFMTVSHVRGTS